MDENLKLWNSVEKTDPSYTKKANVRGNNITAIAPQYQIKIATEMFGPYGGKWGFKELKFDYSLVPVSSVIVFEGLFFYPGGEFPISSSIGAFTDNAKKIADKDFAKKVETDALTKALSKLGFNADVFMGMFDDHKYVSDLKEELSTNANKALVDGYWGATKEQRVALWANYSQAEQHIIISAGQK